MVESLGVAVDESDEVVDQVAVEVELAFRENHRPLLAMSRVEQINLASLIVLSLVEVKQIEKSYFRFDVFLDEFLGQGIGDFDGVTQNNLQVLFETALVLRELEHGDAVSECAIQSTGLVLAGRLIELLFLGLLFGGFFSGKFGASLNHFLESGLLSGTLGGVNHQFFDDGAFDVFLWRGGDLDYLEVVL